MEEVKNVIKQRNQHLLIKQHMLLGGDEAADILEKGQAAQEGETRTWNGKKYIKKQGKWVEVRPQRKKAPQNGKSKKQSKVEDSKQVQQKKEDPKKTEQPQPTVSSHDKGQLIRIKQFVESGDMGRAAELADGLSDEAKNVIPPRIWADIHNHKDDSEMSKETEVDGENENEMMMADEEKGRWKRWIDKNKDLFDTGEHTHPERKKAAKVLRGKMKGLVKGLKHEIHHIKDVGKVIGKAFKGKKPTKDELKSLKKVGIALGLTVGTMLATGGVSAFSHGAIAALKHVGIHFVEHALVENIAMAGIFAKGEENELGEHGLTDEHMDKLLEAVLHEFIEYIENGDLSFLTQDQEQTDEQ